MNLNTNLFYRGILRTPLHPFEKAENLTKQQIIKIASDKDFQDAISISSFQFYNRLINWLNSGCLDEEFYVTLYKYIVRSSTRPTPFGRFGSVSYISIEGEQDRKDKFLLDNTQKQQIKIDGRLLYKIVDYFERIIDIEYLTYFLNHSIYPINDEYRYYEQKINQNDVYYQLSKFDNTEVVSKILNVFTPSGNIRDLFHLFHEDEYTNEELKEFMFSLSLEGILVSELRMYILQSTNLHTLILKLESLEEKLLFNSAFILGVESIKKIGQIIENEEPFSIKVNCIIKLLESLDIHCEVQDLIHIDTVRDTKNNLFIEDSLVQELIEAKNILLRFQSPTNDSFKSFKERFFKRYEYRTVNLLELLDSENGIGFPYEITPTSGNDLMNDISFSSLSSDINVNLSKVEVNLLKKVIEADKKNLLEIDIEEKDVHSHPLVQTSSSISAFFTLLDNSISLNSFVGHSSLNLLSRFSHLDSRIGELCNHISEIESQLNPDIIIAEIMHIPELKSANLLQNKNFRSFEIPCLCQSVDSTIKSIALSDIYVRLRQDNVVELVSKEHKKVILPKLSNSLNFKRNSIPLFEFLSSIESQEKIQYIAFEWNHLLSIFDFLPRVKYKRIILMPALWKVSISEFQSQELNVATVEMWRKKRGIDKSAYLTHNMNDDNKLHIDFLNEIAVETFFKELRKNQNMILIESNNHLQTKQIKDLANNLYANEIILPCFDKHITTRTNQFNHLFTNKEINIFPPGRQWMSLKLYTGYITANDILITDLFPLIERLCAEGLVSKWFFVRYYDESFHLRLRLLVNNCDDIYLVQNQLFPVINRFVDSQLIHNVIIDSYKRENERYNPQYISDIESLFYNDSVAVAKYYGTNSSIWEFAVLSIEALLNDFQMNLLQKKSLLLDIFEGFFREFSGDKKLTLSLDKKYRTIKKRLFEILSSEHNNSFQSILAERSSINIETIETLHENGFQSELENSNIIASIIHMSMNRLFTHQNRKQEFIIYYFLFQYYKSRVAITTKKNSIT